MAGCATADKSYKATMLYPQKVGEGDLVMVFMNNGDEFRFIVEKKEKNVLVGKEVMLNQENDKYKETGNSIEVQVKDIQYAAILSLENKEEVVSIHGFYIMMFVAGLVLLTL